MYYLVASLVGLVAHAALVSPLCLGALEPWHLSSALLITAISVISAALLRGVVRLSKESNAFLIMGGVLHPLVAASLFGFVAVYIDARERLSWGFGQAAVEGLHGCVLGAVNCVVLGYCMFPLGILGVMALRRFTPPASRASTLA